MHVIKYFAGILHAAGEPLWTVVQSVQVFQTWEGTVVNIRKVICKVIALFTLSVKYPIKIANFV